MKSRFDSPTDFLEALAAELATLEPSVQVEPGWRSALEGRRDALPNGSEITLEPVESGRLLVKNLAESVLALVTPEERSQIESSIAIGLLLVGDVNAGIFRSPDGKYAILVNSGLVTLLNKILKLEIAIAHPGSVTYCNRTRATEVTTDLLFQFKQELLDTYRATHVPRGAMVMLSEKERPYYEVALMTAEQFVLCHELAHYLNGDLRTDDSFARYRGLTWVERYRESSDHAAEYAADARAFALLRDGLAPAYGAEAGRLVFHAAAMFFEILHHIDARVSSSTHPAAHDRIRRLAFSHFEPQIARGLISHLHDRA